MSNLENILDPFNMDGYVTMSINKETLDFHHGSYISSFVYNKAELMSIEDFKKHEVNKLNTAKADMYLIRDLTNSRILVMLEDSVLKFDIKKMAEISGAEFREHIDTNRTQDIKTQKWNCKIPIYEYGASASTFTMTLKVPSVKMLFRHVQSSAAKKESIIPIYTPPLLYTVTANHNGTVLHAKVAVLVSDNSGNIVKGHLYFPNIFRDGRLCLGNIRKDSNDSMQVNDYTIAEASFSVWTNSKFDNEMIGAIRPTEVKPAELTEDIQNSDITDPTLKQVLANLKKPEGYKNIVWTRLND